MPGHQGGIRHGFIRAAIHNNAVIPGAPVPDQVFKPSLSQQGGRIGRNRTCRHYVESRKILSGLQDGIRRRQRIHQQMRQTSGILPSAKGGKAGLAQVSVNQEDLFPRLRISGSQIQSCKRLPLARPCRGQEHDSGSLLRIGQQQKFRIIAENMKTFFHEGTAVYDDERQLLALLPGKQRKFPCKRQAHQTDKVILIFHLGIQRVRNHQR